ncbi:MAG TPA: hypothetical protein VGP93_05610, partial [Polyangiaceae bacterium]|nr:hypothetical protein [Polyangiaceae bacterium]
MEYGAYVVLSDKTLAGDGGWQARLELDVERAKGASRVTRKSQLGPLYVQRVLYPEGAEVPHVCLLHPPGGLVGGDCLEITVRAEASTHA